MYLKFYKIFAINFIHKIISFHKCTKVFSSASICLAALSFWMEYHEIMPLNKGVSYEKKQSYSRRSERSDSSLLSPSWFSSVSCFSFSVSCFSELSASALASLGESLPLDGLLGVWISLKIYTFPFEKFIWVLLCDLQPQCNCHVQMDTHLIHWYIDLFGFH